MSRVSHESTLINLRGLATHSRPPVPYVAPTNHGLETSLETKVKKIGTSPSHIDPLVRFRVKMKAQEHSKSADASFFSHSPGVQ